MSSPDKQDKFDHWLDDALRQYGNAEPRSGLEMRVLANLRSAHAARRSTWKRALAGSAAATALVIASLWFAGEQARHQRNNAKNSNVHTPTVLHATNQSGTPEQFARNSTKPGQNAAIRTKRTNTRLELAAAPRLSQFPSPRPLSEQERLLLAYVHEFPKEAAEVAREQAEEEKRMEALYHVEPDLQQER